MAPDPMRRESKRLRSSLSEESNPSPVDPPEPSAKRKASKTPSSKAATPAPKLASDSAWYNVFTKGDADYNRYMATEWGFEKRGDQALFEKQSLEAAQSGLSWLTILRKREAYRRTFHSFEIAKVAAMNNVYEILAQDMEPRDMVVRHRGKIEAVINNAQRILELQAADGEGAFDRLLWSFVNDQPILNRWDGNLSTMPTKTPESEAMSKELKKRGFRFVGPTTCYAMMQSVGMVIDHPVDSPEWKASLERLKKRPGGYQDGATSQSS